MIKRARRDKALVLTTHSMEEAEALCDRLGIFVGGRLQCVGNPKARLFFFTLDILAATHFGGGALLCGAWQPQCAAHFVSCSAGKGFTGAGLPGTCA